MTMRTDELDYDLPSELIAQTPVEPRDASRLLVVSGRGDGLRFDERRFGELPGILRAGDVLVRNDTRVLPARTHFRRATGGRVEILFLEPAGACGPESTDDHVGVVRPGAGSERPDGARPDPALVGSPVTNTPTDESVGVGNDESDREWEVLARGRLREGEVLVSDSGGDAFTVELRRRLGEGRWLVACRGDESPARLLVRYGDTPLPPYIKARLDDPERYQTVYAAAEGSAAAPTAGLHFTPELDARLDAAGIAIEHLTLHVGLATFKPVTTEVLEDHPLHDEPFTVRRDVWERIRDAAASGRRVVAVGTTMVRLLEELGRRETDGDLVWRDDLVRGRTGLFITPGHEFGLVGAMLTNFHLPRTSLLGLVMAFCGAGETRRAYEHAIGARYRFYSFGDAMLASPDRAAAAEDRPPARPS